MNVAIIFGMPMASSESWHRGSKRFWVDHVSQTMVNLGIKTN
jgi:hypothetical protein